MNVCASCARTELVSGITTIRSVGGIRDVLHQIFDEIVLQ